MPLPVTVQSNSVSIGRHFSFSFHRTLRVPDDDRTRGLPAGLGHFDVSRVDDYADRVPPSWVEHGGVFICMWPHEAMWINFHGVRDVPVAVRVAAGKVCAVTGKPWSPALEGGAEQNYMVVPGQRWIDGFKCADGRVRQFVGTLLGSGETVEKQVTGKEEVGGLQLQVFETRPDRRPPPNSGYTFLRGASGSGCFGGTTLPEIYCMAADAQPMMQAMAASSDIGKPLGARVKGAEMGLGAGGLIEQAILNAGEYQPDAFDPEATGRVFIHIVDAAMYKEITGKKPHASPITPEDYRKAGYPWFSTWGEDAGKDVKVKPALAEIKSVGQIQKEKAPKQSGLINADNDKVVHLGGKPVSDGNW